MHVCLSACVFCLKIAQFYKFSNVIRLYCVSMEGYTGFSIVVMESGLLARDLSSNPEKGNINHKTVVKMSGRSLLVMSIDS